MGDGVAKKQVLIGFLGTVLDAGYNKNRHQKWRPNVNVHQATTIDRVELFVSAKYHKLAERVVSDIEHIAPKVQVNLVAMELANPWDFSEVYQKLLDWALSYPFDIEKENYLTHITTGTHVAQICLFLLVESRQIPSVLLQTAPPKLDGEHCRVEKIDLELARYDVLAQRLQAVKDNARLYLKSGIATQNTAFNQMIAQIERVALGSSLPILLTGATGVGKSQLARRIFELKKSRHLITGQFVEVNCATLRGDGAMSALFGHVKGAFTGALSARLGYLKVADGGMLFLDEIGELGLDEQAMLLKAIEDKRFYPLGSDKEVASAFELIAGTNLDLYQAVKAGRFRADLLARINIWQYHLPALCHRREDIAPNIEHQLQLASQELGRVVRFNAEAYQMYLDFALSEQASWQGNFRDLSASILRLATLAAEGRIDVAQVQAEIERLCWQWGNQDKQSDDTGSNTPINETLFAKIDELAIDVFEKLQLKSVLAICQEHDSLAGAGRALFAVSRQHKKSGNDSDRLRKYLGKYGLTWEQVAKKQSS